MPGVDEKANALSTPSPKKKEREETAGLSESGDTSLILRGFPNYLTQGALISMLEDLHVSLRNALDFAYVPWDPYLNSNAGYAILNFKTAAIAAQFRSEIPTGALACRILRQRSHFGLPPAAMQHCWL